MSLQAFQQLTGANSFFYYGATIFQSVGLRDNFVTQTILGMVGLVCTFGGLYVMERFGRRVPLIIGGIWQAMWLFAFAIAGTVRDPTTNPDVGKVMIVSACMFILGYSMTWSPGIWIIVSETFPTRTRARQVALATSVNWLWNFLLAFFTPFIVSAIYFKYGFIFAACNLTGAVVVYLFLYESSDLSLESVDDVFAFLFPFDDVDEAGEKNHRCTTILDANRGLPDHGYSSRRELVQKRKAAGASGGAFEENVIGGVTSESESSYENEKSGMGNGVRIAVTEGFKHS